MLKSRFVPLAVLGGVALSLAASSPAVLAGPPTPAKKAAPAPASYECQKCHMRFSAAVAKKNKFVDPMDGGKLTLVKAAPKSAPAAKPTTPKK